MAQQQQNRSQPERDPLAAAIETSVKYGAVCGGVGFLFGGAAGIVKGLPTFFAATASSIQTFGLGTAFTLTRLGIIHGWTTEEHSPTSSELVKASALAGGVSGGSMGFLFRGRRNVLPAIIMWSIFGAAGQFTYNKWTAPTPSSSPPLGFWQSMSEKSWTPFKMLTNEEYAAMLKEKQLRIDVELSILDDKISALKNQQGEERNAEAPEAQKV